MVWMGVAGETDPTAWGWKQERDELIPIMTDKNAAPGELLKIIYCKCSRECKSARCSCRRYGLPCTAACGPCQVENSDSPNYAEEVNAEEEEEHDTQN
jgi:hypothetical protein